MTDFRCFPTAFYIPCWNVDHANKNLDCFDKNRQMMQPQQQGTQAILRIISMAQSASRQYDAKPDCVLIGHSTKPERCAHLAFRGFPLWSSKNILASSFFFALLLSSFLIRECANKNLINIQPSWSHAWSITHIKSLYMCIKGLQRSPSPLRRKNTKPALTVS